MLEGALAVAKAGELERPPVPGPNRLLPYLQFAKFPPKALEVARRVLDDDPDFRARVLAEVDLERIGPAGRLVLEQPAGWEDQLRALEDATAGEVQEARAARQERRATKQLLITREMLEQATSQASDEAAHAARVESDLQGERHARQRLEGRLAAMVEEVDQARVERRRAVSELKAVEARLRDRMAELRDARARINELEAELRARPPSGGERFEVPAADEPPPEPPLDRAELAEAVGRANGALDGLAAALSRATELLDAASPAAATAGAAAGRDPAGRPPRRRPTRLPLGVFDDAVEAADALFAVPEMLVMVDGYNVSLTGWPELPLDMQRDRLIDGLAGLEARTGVRVVVMFDGAETGRHLPPESRLRSVQVRFTEPDVEADDALLAGIEQVPPTQPVTVVSSDNRVRRGTAARGANVLSSEQLLAVLRRA